jgi:hypothetical protein
MTPVRVARRATGGADVLPHIRTSAPRGYNRVEIIAAARIRQPQHVEPSHCRTLTHESRAWVRDAQIVIAGSWLRDTEPSTGIAYADLPPGRPGGRPETGY